MQGTKNAQKDFYIKQPYAWNQALEKIALGAWKSVVFSTVQHEYS